MKHSVISKVLTSTCLLAFFSTSVVASQSDVETALKANDLSAAIIAYKALSKDESSNIDGQMLWASILLEQDKIEDAYDLLEDLKDKNSDNAELQFSFGQVSMAMVNEVSMFSKLGYAKDGIKAWEKAIELDPTYEDALKGIIGFYRVAPSIAGGDIDKALEHALKLKALNEPAGIERISQVYQTMEKEDLATKELDEGIAKYPKNSRLLYLRGVNSLKSEKWSASYQDLNGALSLTDDKTDDKTDETDILYQLGKLAVKSGENIDSTIESVKKLMTMENHRYPQWGNLRLAQLYKVKGDFINAKSTLALVDDDDDDKLEDEVDKLKKELRKLMK